MPPKKSTPKKVDVKGGKSVTPVKSPQKKVSAPKAPVPKVSVPKVSVPKVSAPKAPVPKAPAPKSPAPKAPVPKVSAPKVSVPKAPLPKVSAPKSPVPKAPLPKVSAPKSPVPKVSAPKISPKKAAGPSKVVVSPPPIPSSGKRAQPATVTVAPQPLKRKKTDEGLIVKVMTKGGAAVDAFVLNKQKFCVYQEGGKCYSATLNQSNLDNNNNKFYIIQLLMQESTTQLYLFCRWGRVGVPGQQTMMGPWAKQVCLREYQKKVHEKTVKGDYKEIEIKYDDEKVADAKPQDKSKPSANVASKLDAGLQKLISLIFDVTVMNNTMKEIGYDASKMPLGKLGQTTIKQAYTVLTELSQAIKNSNKEAMKKLSSDFYTLIPHNFGFKNMMSFILDNDEKVKEKVKMLETISDLKITSKLMEQTTKDDSAILDQNYEKLGCSIRTLNEKQNEYSVLKEYFDNTKGNYSKVTVGEIYEVVRPTEQKAFNNSIGNNMLLWHGSRVSNFVGILSQGLRIAPPEAPVSGYLFGKGIYLADLAEKSINYCRSHGSDSALILLIQGAIGNPNVLLQSNCAAKEAMEKAKKDSTKCHGAKAPPQSSYVQLNGVTVPLGKPVPTLSGSYMGHNEYIVYSMAQARIKYIVRMDMKGS